MGPAPALTGPVSRGDSPTLAGHLEVLKEGDPLELDLYRTLCLYTIRVALEKGSINPAQALELESLFKPYEEFESGSAMVRSQFLSPA